MIVNDIIAVISLYLTEFISLAGLLHLTSYRGVEFQQRQFDLTVTTFEYLCGFAIVGDKHLLLLGVYRSGSQALSALFFGELSSVLELLAVHSCPVVVYGDFNIHVDQSGDQHAIRPVSYTHLTLPTIYSV